MRLYVYMGKLFQPEHYNTAERLGVPSIQSHYADGLSENMAVAELALTLPKLLKVDPQLMVSLRDLYGYNYLHYGAPHKATQSGIRSSRHNAKRHDEDGYIGTLNRILEEVLLDDGEPSSPLELGRIAVDSENDLGGLDQFGVLKETVSKVATDTSYVDPEDTIESYETYKSETRGGQFVYPNPGVRFVYLGGYSLDLSNYAKTLLNAGTDHGYISDFGPSKTLDVHVEHFEVIKRGGVHLPFTALSHVLGHGEDLVSIYPVATSA